jgi:hypothetical protein
LQATFLQFDRSRFDHVGLITDERKKGESWVEATRVWVTSPRAHPFNVEFLRFEPDSPVTRPLRTQPHIACRVVDVRAALDRLEVPISMEIEFTNYEWPLWGECVEAARRGKA